MVVAPSISERKVTDITRAQKTHRSIHKQVETYQIGISGMMGLDNSALAGMSGMTPGQVSYRMVQTGASQLRREYRKGRGALAQYILKHTKAFAEREFVALMQERLGLQKP